MSSIIMNNGFSREISRLVLSVCSGGGGGSALAETTEKPVATAIAAKVANLHAKLIGDFPWICRSCEKVHHLSAEDFADGGRSAWACFALNALIRSINTG
jgi:hypothetical protein